MTKVKINREYVNEIKSRKYNNIGILGGSFNPITYSHIMTAVRCAELEDLDCIIIEPVGDNYDKKGLLPAKTRIEIIKTAIKEIEGSISIPVFVGDFEANGWINTTYNTLNFYKEELTQYDATAPKISYICGSDVLESMGTWGGDVSNLIEEFHIICVDRVENGKNIEFDIINNNELLFRNRRKIRIVPAMTYNEISSSLVRYRIKYGMSVVGLVPTSIIPVISKLYKK